MGAKWNVCPFSILVCEAVQGRGMMVHETLVHDGA